VADFKRSEKKCPMKYLLGACVGFAWSLLALVIGCLFGMTTADVGEVAPKFAAAGILTGVIVTCLFRVHLFSPDIRKKYWLPFATIACAVPIWSAILFTTGAVLSVVHGRHDLFDGFGYFLIAGVSVSLTVALPITYPIAYLSQLLLSRYAGPRKA
jgi:hypothetical protein